MFKRLLLLAAVLGPAAAPRPALAQDAKAPPTVVVRVQSLDALVENGKYLAGLTGQEELAKQAEGFLKAKTGPKGLEGVDPKKPFGLYGKVGPNGIDSTVVALLPIANEKEFLDFLDRINVKPEKKGQGDVYMIQPEGMPLPVYFRFANGYAYFTVQEAAAIDKAKLLPPDTVKPADAAAVASAVVRLDQVPDDLKQIALGQMKLRLADLKDKEQPGETKSQAEFRKQLLDEVSDQVTALVRDGTEVEARLDIDRKAGTIALETSLKGKPQSKLSANIAELSKATNLFAGLPSADSAASATAGAALPEKLRKALEPVLDEGFKKALDDEKDAAKRERAKLVFQVLGPTLKSGTFDGGFDLRKAPKAEHYTLVGGVRVKDGLQIEKAMRELVKDAKPADRAKIKLDAEKYAGANVHQIDVSKDLDANARDSFGDKPLYFAFRPDALVVAFGDDGLNALKGALDLKPTSEKAVSLRAEMAFGRLAKLMARDQKAAPKAAEQAFAGKKDADTIRLSVRGGDELTVRVEMKAPVLTFFSLIDKADKGGK